MAQRQKISQMASKGANLEATDLLEISEASGSGYITKSITGAEIIASGGGGDMLKSVYDPQDTGIVLSAHKEMVAVINKTGSPVTEGSIVYLKSTSSSGTYPEILLADADTEATSTKTLGAVYETIANDATGYVVTSGEVDNLDTSMYVIGTKLWLSQTAGQVTSTPPVQPAHTVFIGTVTRSQNGNGRILYAIQNGYELEELHNVLITSVANNETLVYESSSLLWKNKTIATALGYTPAPTEITIARKAASYVLVLTDSYKLIEMDVSTANTLTIPTNTAQPFLAGTQILITQYGTGQVTITPDTGVTLRSSGGKTKTGAQYAMATLIKRSTNEWYLAGDITT
jgi:hypothetical protein